MRAVFLSVAAVVVSVGCANLIGADFDSKRAADEEQDGNQGGTAGVAGEGVGDSPKGDAGAGPDGSGGQYIDGKELVINEISATQGAEFIEVYNKGSVAYNLGGHALFKNSTEIHRFEANTHLQAQEFAVIWRHPAPAGCVRCLVYTHVNIEEGDHIELRTMTALIDSAEYPPGVPEQGAYGRSPDGTGDFVMLEQASPGLANYVP